MAALARDFTHEVDVKQLDDKALAEHICLCDMQLQSAQQLYEDLRTASMNEARQEWRKRFEAALRERARRPAMVAQLEREKGLL